MLLQIEKLVYGGKGMARTPDGVVFAGRVLPGETVEVEPVERRKDYVLARLTEVVAPSPDRREPLCPNFHSAGCCDWSHIRYEAQAAIKESIIRESLTRLGRIAWDRPIDRLHGPETGGRLRVAFHVENNRLCFVQEESNRKVPIESCAALMPELNRFIGEAAAALAGPELAGTETVRAVAEPQTGAVDATFHRGRQRAAWRGRRLVTTVAGIQHRLKPDDFFQPNRHLLEPLLGEVVRAAGGPKTVLDLFCGGGFFSLPLARQAAKVIAIDRHSPANARWNARRNRIENVEFIQASAAHYLASVRTAPELVVLDPPRTGAGKAAIERIAALGPARIVYVSCNPTTFAPEARRLIDRGYALSSLKFVDQFPGTHHIETVAVLER